ncbi:hypothetical protein A8924_2265 [Saccharopolyspora erythraea NRRL 2338]|uniref:Uncharacterized protein n=2 Tax=Saccharopolyspora erythraea TaxID=1836 RepID=A4FAV3_SACEN|nr:hypothetical protein [Saccharopolyspora erythraea]EQD87572.1 hypothetical protein N599_03300 [Saccharopolyspora erythraea D]PFG94960.1 hypothetical protein A8924_2265 [Saccharopolyspora erythraea NRRL 2338]QRK91652.1 hypothetical protein JQX30_09880 [Saccharopolyspora erythraea]CAM01178.1 hypothetical protein SACE_1866 [Saccharopolyspora erythraea NRRL 2338]
MTGRDAAVRADLRAFVRTHHPDVGGDPEVFAAGLAELRARQARELELDDARYDAPIVIVHRPGVVRGVARRIRGWRRRRHRPRVR